MADPKDRARDSDWPTRPMSSRSTTDQATPMILGLRVRLTLSDANGQAPQNP